MPSQIISFAQVSAADQPDKDSQPNNNATTTPSEDDEAVITVTSAAAAQEALQAVIDQKLL